MPFITQGKTNFKYILIVIILAAIVGVGILAYQQWWVKNHLEKLSEFPELKIPEKITQDETANWETYRNEKYGFEVEYPENWKIFISGPGTWTEKDFGGVLSVDLLPEKWEEPECYKENPSFGYVDKCPFHINVYNKTYKDLRGQNFYQIQNEKDQEFFGSFPIGTWVMPGGKGAVEEAEEITLAGQKAVRGTHWFGTHDNGYSGMDLEEIVVLGTPQDHYSFEFIIPGFIYSSPNEVPAKILSTFKFTETENGSSKEEACINSGGNVETSLCCKSASDFPNLCLIGPCGCSPENSHQIKTCDCGSGKCFNGTECVTSQSP